MIKIYSIAWILKDTIWDELRDVSSFSSQENGWSGRLVISLKNVSGQIDYEIGDEAQYFIDWELVFCGNIIEIEEDENVSSNFMKLNVLWKAHFIGNYNMNQSYNDTLENILTSIISKYNIERARDVLFLGSIISDSATYSVSIGEATYLEYLRELSKQTGFLFHIKNNWEINFWVWENRSLTFWGDVESIRNIKTSSLISSLEIFNSIWIVVNKKYSYYAIKPLDNIKIQNNNKYNWSYRVAKIVYWKEKATIELENFISFTKLIWN